MSLLNDALRRAADTDRNRTSPPLSPLQPVTYTGRPNWALRFALTVLLVVALGLSAFFLTRWSSRRQGVPASNPGGATLAAAPPSASAAALTPGGRNAATPAPLALQAGTAVARPAGSVRSPSPPTPASPAPATDAAATVSAGTRSTSNSVPARAPEAEDRFPALKLQSIIFRLSQPSAVINGQMLGVGDAVAGARVVRIDRHAVVVAWKGLTNVLEMPKL
jgi:hypothetical protein